jgi:signal transduction histidine kinase
MNKSIIVLMLVLAQLVGFGQSVTKLDSLKKVLAKLPPEGTSYASDTTRVRVLCEIEESMVYTNLGDSDSTLKTLESALKIADNRHWEDGVAICYFKIGEYFIVKNELMKAADYLYKCLAISIEQKNETLTAETYKALGDCYSMLGNYSRAVELNAKSNAIFKSYKDQTNYIKGLNNLGLIYFDMQNYDKAISIFKNGLVLNQKYRYPKLDAYFRVNMGMALVKRKSYDEALKNFNEVLNDNRRNPNNDVYVYISMADIYEKRKDYTKALVFYEKSKKLMETAPSNGPLQMLLEEVGYKIFKNTNQYQKAFESFMLYNEINQRNTKQDADKRVKNLQLEFDNQNQKKEIDSWKRNVMFTIGGMSILLILGISLFRANSKLSKKKKTIEIQKDEIEQINKQLAEFNVSLEEKVTLRTQELSQLNADLVKKNEEILTALVKGQTLERKRVSAELHDNLGSTISGIKYKLQALDLANFTEKEKHIYLSVMTMMNDAYSEVRLISHNLLPTEFEQKGLRGALEKLVDDVNMSEKIKMTLIYKEPKTQIEQEIAIEVYSICLELVNNIIKHSAGTEGEVYFFTNAKNVILNVRDNGGNAQKLSEGFGLKNIKERVSKFDGLVELHTDDNETDVTIKIPVVLGFPQKDLDNTHKA